MRALSIYGLFLVRGIGNRVLGSLTMPDPKMSRTISTESNLENPETRNFQV